MRILCSLMMVVGLGCGFSAVQRQAAKTSSAPRSLSVAWVPVTLASVQDKAIRATLDQALRVAGDNVIWPGFTIDEHSIVFAFEKPVSAAYCIGSCGARPASRLWRLSSRVLPASGNIFGEARAWALPGAQDRVVVVRQRYGIDAVAFAVHEDFHLTFETRYGRANPEALEGGGDQRAHMLSRRDLETTYAHQEDVSRSVSEECRLLADALRQLQGHRVTEARQSVQQFLLARAERRRRPDAPVSEENYWERLEGVPTNLERRAARLVGEQDPSIIADAVNGTVCSQLGTFSYFLVLGALQAAILDDAGVAGWESYVYPSGAEPSISLSELLRERFVIDAARTH